MRGRLRKVRWNVLLGVSSHDNYSASLRSSAASSSDIAIVYLLSTCNAILKDLTPLLREPALPERVRSMEGLGAWWQERIDEGDGVFILRTYSRWEVLIGAKRI